MTIKNRIQGHPYEEAELLDLYTVLAVIIVIVLMWVIL